MSYKKETLVRDAFHRAYKGQKNFLTPYILGRTVHHGGYYYELSRGTGINGGLIFGLTVVTPTGRKCPDLSTFCANQKEIDYALMMLPRWHGEA